MAFEQGDKIYFLPYRAVMDDSYAAARDGVVLKVLANGNVKISVGGHPRDEQYRQNGHKAGRFTPLTAPTIVKVTSESMERVYTAKENRACKRFVAASIARLQEMPLGEQVQALRKAGFRG